MSMALRDMARRTSPGGASPTKEDTHSRLSDMGGGERDGGRVGSIQSLAVRLCSYARVW
jgi:hypothetical protein